MNLSPINPILEPSVLEEGKKDDSLPLEAGSAPPEQETTEETEMTETVKSVANVLLVKNPSSKIMKIAFGVTILQCLTSLMVAINSISGRPEGRPTYDKILTYLAASLAIACSVNESCVEFWVNNRALENLVKENKKNREFSVKNSLVTLYFVAQLLLVIATIASITHQANPIGIVTDSTGLLLIQQLDSQLFHILKIPCAHSEEVKRQVSVVEKQKQYSPEQILTFSTSLLFSIIIVVAFGRDR